LANVTLSVSSCPHVRIVAGGPAGVGEASDVGALVAVRVAVGASSVGGAVGVLDAVAGGGALVALGAAVVVGDADR
jgi:hypothetical protein